MIAQNDSDDDVDLEQKAHCTGTVWAGDVEIEEEWEQPCRQESWADKVATNAWQLLRAAGLPGQDVDVDVNKDKSSQISHSVNNFDTAAKSRALSCNLTLSTSSKALDHKAEVPPIFIPYRRVSAEGARISLVQVATLVINAMCNETALDVVQPMRNG